MKKVLALLLVASLSSCVMNNTKYRIESNGTTYYTDSYTSNGNGCINFQNKNCACGENKTETVTICGTYTITDLNQK